MKQALSYVGKKASDYDKKREGSNKWKTENLAVEALLPTDIDTVLDIPCGTGRFFNLYERRKLNYVGVDVSNDMLQVAQAKHESANLMIADIRALGKSIGEFDCAVCCRLTGWLDPGDLKKALNELFRVAKFVVVGMRTSPGDPLQKGKLWVHSHEYFLSCIAGRRIEAVYPLKEKRILHNWPEIKNWQSYVTTEKGYCFYRIISNAN